MSVSDSLSTAEVARLLNRHGASAFTEDVRLLFEDYFTHHAATDGMQSSDDDDDSEAKPVMPDESIETSQPVIPQHQEDDSELRPVVETAVNTTIC